MDRAGDWFQSVKGNKIWPLDPRPEDVDIEEIAHALAHICRFNGHLPFGHYSVAEHSVYTMRYVQEKQSGDPLVALLHDAAEAYFGDIIRPVKRSSMTLHDTFAQIEKGWNSAISNALRVTIPDPMPKYVKEADDAVLMAERRDLLVRSHAWAERCAGAWEGKIEMWDAGQAKREFLRAYERLRS